MSAAAILHTSTTTGPSGPTDDGAANVTFQAWGTTTAGAGAATINIEGSNHTSAPWITLGTITLVLGTTAVTDGFVVSAPWLYTRANVTAISGTGASVTVAYGV
jgi:hypothetical protein